MSHKKKKFKEQHDEAHLNIIPTAETGIKIQQFYLSPIGIPPYQHNSGEIKCREDYQIRSSQIGERSDYFIQEKNG